MAATTAEGITIIVSGYSDSIDELLIEIVDNFNEIAISKEQYEAIKDQLIRDWKNNLRHELPLNALKPAFQSNFYAETKR